MEPVEKSIRYVTYSRVNYVYERFQSVWRHGLGKEAVFDEVSQGFFVVFSGSFEALHLGSEPPTFRPGDKVKITFEKVTPCPPSVNTNPLISSSSLP